MARADYIEHIRELAVLPLPILYKMYSKSHEFEEVVQRDVFEKCVLLAMQYDTRKWAKEYPPYEKGF